MWSKYIQHYYLFIILLQSPYVTKQHHVSRVVSCSVAGLMGSVNLICLLGRWSGKRQESC